jgi:hypothetical protein
LVLGEELVEVLEEFGQTTSVVDDDGVVVVAREAGTLLVIDDEDGELPCPARCEPWRAVARRPRVWMATTQIYAQVSIGHLKETLQRCHPRERGNLEAKDKDDDPNGRRDS